MPSTPIVTVCGALKDNGAVVTWGKAEDGGDSSEVAEELSSGVQALFTTGGAWAALKANGSVVTWGTSETLCNTCRTCVSAHDSIGPKEPRESAEIEKSKCEVSH